MMTRDMAEFLIANIEMIPRAKTARRLKVELHMIVQRFMALRHLSMKLNETIIENKQIQQLEAQNKAASPRNSSRYRTQESKMEPLFQCKGFSISKQVEFEAEKVKILFAPK